MAIDTQGERYAVANMGRPVAAFLPVADGSFSQLDRYTLLRTISLDTFQNNDVGVWVCVDVAVPLSVQVSTAFDIAVEVGPV